MGEVAVKLNGRTYDIACDDGQENRVRELAAYVDNKARDVARSGAAQTETHLMVLTSIILSDEIVELQRGIADVQSRMQQKSSPKPGLSKEDEKAVADMITQLAKKIDALAKKV
ncbi:MAG: cell division protein ZapA [Alphaproteobacteria bacterium]|nr:cell division protein ZapA [Alphaproteobacteria bacterium]